MNQWSGLNVQIIKSKRIQCEKLQLPKTLTSPTKSPSRVIQQPLKTLQIERSKSLNDTNVSKGCSFGRDSREALSESMGSTLLLSESLCEEENEGRFLHGFDDVFDEVSQTPNSQFYPKATNACHKRCLTYPGDPNSEICADNYSNITTSGGSMMPPCDDVSTRDCSPPGCWPCVNYPGYAREERWTRFPRQPGSAERVSSEHNTAHSSESGHAAKLIEQNKREFPPCTITAVTDRPTKTFDRPGSKSNSDFTRQDWDINVLGYTSRSVFGACHSRGQLPSVSGRPKSVTLTGSLVNIGENCQNYCSDSRVLNKRQLTSEGKQHEMPKLQNVLRDYVKRRSTKRKEQKESRAIGDKNGQHSAQETVKTTQDGINSTGYDNDQAKSRTTTNSNVSKDPNYDNTTNRNYKLGLKGRRFVALTKAKSTSNLTESHGTTRAPDATTKAIKRSKSLDKLSQNHKKLSLDQFKDDPSILQSLLTTWSERRPIKERLKTLEFSREWLHKELKSLRDDDRRLARQFIHLRSAILEVKKAREIEDLDFDHDPGEWCKEKFVHPEKLALQQEIGKESEYQSYVTTTENILNYHYAQARYYSNTIH